VHKAQGSQYGELLLLLPRGRQLDARLLYTGLTRARHCARIYTPLPAVARVEQAP
jgi:ATP-dependent exoDNAse (exonuclease V) alpha subunit